MYIPSFCCCPTSKIHFWKAVLGKLTCEFSKRTEHADVIKVRTVPFH